jgi:hypothetical protein
MMAESWYIFGFYVRDKVTQYSKTLFKELLLGW